MDRTITSKTPKPRGIVGCELAYLHLWRGRGHVGGRGRGRGRGRAAGWPRRNLPASPGPSSPWWRAGRTTALYPDGLYRSRDNSGAPPESAACSGWNNGNSHYFHRFPSIITSGIHLLCEIIPNSQSLRLSTCHTAHQSANPCINIKEKKN